MVAQRKFHLRKNEPMAFRRSLGLVEYPLVGLLDLGRVQGPNSTYVRGMILFIELAYGKIKNTSNEKLSPRG